MVTLTIDGLAAGGDGIGRMAGKAVFVPLTAPGDVAEVRIVSDGRSFSRGVLHRLVSPSSKRCAPPCTVFGDCGGCQWQHITGEAQLEAKESLTVEALRRIGGLEPPEGFSVTPSPKPYGYRHRARLHVAAAGKGVGFYRSGSHDVVAVEQCPVLHESLNRLLPPLGRLFASRRGGPMPAGVTLATDYSGVRVRISFIRRGGRNLDPGREASDRLRLEAETGDGGITLSFDGHEPLALGPGTSSLAAAGDAFTQVNLLQNSRLVAAALAAAGPLRGKAVLDLFCGIGNLSLPAAAAGAAVTGVDTSADAVTSALENVRRLGITGATFRREDSSAALRSLAGEGRRFDTVFLNPPRRGCPEIAGHIGLLGPSRVVMVSCDAATFARDAARMRDGGFRLSALRGLDLFPQTCHVETIGLFEA